MRVRLIEYGSMNVPLIVAMRMQQDNSYVSGADTARVYGL